MKNSVSINSLQIGKLGELLVQYELLLHGIESAPLTTDAGIDLVAYSPKNKKPVTIQVKTNLQPKPGGGKGPDAIDWTVPDDSPAEMFAFVDVSQRQVWFLTKEELHKTAQQHSKKGKYHFYMYVADPSRLKGKIGTASHISKFNHYLLETRLKEIFG